MRKSFLTQSIQNVMASVFISTAVMTSAPNMAMAMAPATTISPAWAEKVNVEYYYGNHEAHFAPNGLKHPHLRREN